MRVDMCYTEAKMRENHHIWQRWATVLHRWGMQGMVAWLLDALGPFHLFGAQLVYVSQPLLSVFVPESDMDALAQILEKPQSTRAFLTFLKEDAPL